jgi:hypothetical protein
MVIRSFFGGGVILAWQKGSVLVLFHALVMEMIALGVGKSE